MGRWVREEVGLPTILVNNAGTGSVAEFASQKPDDWEPMIDLNIKAGLFCISEFLADMKEAKKGHIVNISSINEKAGRPGMAVYGSTKLFWEGKCDKGFCHLMEIHTRYERRLEEGVDGHWGEGYEHPAGGLQHPDVREGG